MYLSFLESSTLALTSISEAFLLLLTTLLGLETSISPSTPLAFGWGRERESENKHQLM